MRYLPYPHALRQWAVVKRPVWLASLLTLLLCALILLSSLSSSPPPVSAAGDVAVVATPTVRVKPPIDDGSSPGGGLRGPVPAVVSVSWSADLEAAARGAIGGANPTRVPIPDNDGWVGSRIDITGAPASAVVVAIDVRVVIRHDFIGDLVVDVSDAPETRGVRLWDRQGGNGQDINRVWLKLTGFAGLPVNRGWMLWVSDNGVGDVGYIESWAITIYYTIPTPSPSPTCAIPLTPPYQVHINAGATAYTDAGGQVWQADRLFRDCAPPYWGATGGQTFINQRPIAGAEEDTLYQSQRYFSTNAGYLFQLPNGFYDVRLLFAEIYTWTLPGMRAFDVRVQGALIADNLDVAARAGGAFHAFELTASTVVTDQRLFIQFLPQGSQSPAFVSAISVVQTGLAPTPFPISTPTPTPTPTSAPGRYLIDVPVAADSITSQSNPDANYASTWELVTGPRRSRRIWLDFDIASQAIPANAEISNAVLYLWRSSGGDIDINVYAVAAPWEAATLTWNNQPAVAPVPVVSRFIPAGVPDYVALNVTDLFAQWVRGVREDHGISISDDNQAGTVTFASKENSPAGHPAMIRVSYVVAPEPTVTPTPTVTGTSTVTPTPTATVTASATGTVTPSPTPTQTPTPTPTTPSAPARSTVFLPIVRTPIQ